MRLSSEQIRVILPVHCVNRHALWHFSTKADFVLTEETHDWLRDNNAPFSIEMHFEKTNIIGADPDFYEYDIIFYDLTHATFFKLRWH